MAKIITILGITGKQVGLVLLCLSLRRDPVHNTPSNLTREPTQPLTEETQGSSVATTFLSEGSWHIRGITRDPTSLSSQIWANKGVELVQGDMNDAASLKSAFAGSHVVFGVSDFWAAVRDPAVQERAKAAGVPINKYAYDIEVQQGRNIVDAAASVDTLERFVLSTLSPTRKWSKGKYVHVYHHDAKWEAVEHLRRTYPELDGKMSLLQMTLYMTNEKDFGPMGVGRPVRVRLMRLSPVSLGSCGSLTQAFNTHSAIANRWHIRLETSWSS